MKAWRPPGTTVPGRGGMLINYEFPADGEYAIKITPISKGSIMNILRLGQIYQVKLSAAVQMSSGVRCP